MLKSSLEVVIVFSDGDPYIPYSSIAKSEYGFNSTDWYKLQDSILNLSVDELGVQNIDYDVLDIILVITTKEENPFTGDEEDIDTELYHIQNHKKIKNRRWITILIQKKINTKKKHTYNKKKQMITIRVCVKDTLQKI